jgi:hypothetical protein
MRFSRHLLLGALVVLIGSVWSVSAQAPYRLSEKEMKELLSRIDKQAEAFRGSLKSALNHSRIDDTKAEDRINDFMKDFQHATDRLKDHYGDKNTASSDVEDVLRRAARIDSFMGRHHLTPRAESDWAALRQNLDTLAEAYGVTWSWTDRDR